MRRCVEPFLLQLRVEAIDHAWPDRRDRACEIVQQQPRRRAIAGRSREVHQRQQVGAAGGPELRVLPESLARTSSASPVLRFASRRGSNSRASRSARRPSGHCAAR
jgi:hypothetical protein